ncbi:MAG TPA: radical SAM protein [bacterium]|nr:radical SAM protein [bacterium]HPN30370.1 radical SAM protein [bacterium]
MKNNILPIFIPQYGCKQKCVFCDQKKITSTFDLTSIETQIKSKIELCKNKNISEIAFFGGSFTGIKIDIQKKLLESVIEFAELKNAYVRISTYPEFINADIIKFLKSYRVKIIELGVQSLNEKVLEASGRFYNIDKVVESSNIIKSSGIKLGHQIMLGLPESSLAIELETIKKIKEINPHFLRIYPVVIIKNTKLEIMYNQKKYEPLRLSEIIDRCVSVMFSLENTDIKIIRIGLHSEPQFVSNSILDTGSYHPALGELVKSEYICRKIKNILKKNCNIRNLNVKYPLKWSSLLFGQKNKYKKIYKEMEIDFFIDDSLSGKIEIYSDNERIDCVSF